MRLFFAVKIPTESKNELAEFVDQFLQFPGKVKWVEPENLHLTLKFLGETDPKLLDETKQSGMRSIAGISCFDITLRGCGAFPNTRAPRVLWVGIDDPGKHLRSIAEKLDRNLTQLGFEPEKRPFSPHLTLARIKEPQQLDLLMSAFQRASFGPVTIPVEALYLIESHLKPSGPVYKDVAEFRLTN